MTDKHIDRFLTQSPVEQLFRELNQISFKTEKPRNPEYRYRYSVPVPVKFRSIKGPINIYRYRYREDLDEPGHLDHSENSFPFSLF